MKVFRHFKRLFQGAEGRKRLYFVSAMFLLGVVLGYFLRGVV